MSCRDEFTDELMRHEGLAGSSGAPPCGSCLESSAIYRCLDCPFGIMLCLHCMVAAHQAAPLHSVQVRPASPFPSICYLTDASRSGPELFLPGSRCSISVPHISLVIVLVKNVHGLPPSSILPSSTFLVSRPFASTTASVGHPGNNYDLASNLCACGGSPQR